MTFYTAVASEKTIVPVNPNATTYQITFINTTGTVVVKYRPALEGYDLNIHNRKRKVGDALYNANYHLDYNDPSNYTEAQFQSNVAFVPASINLATAARTLIISGIQLSALLIDNSANGTPLEFEINVS
jgi:neutral trehalase